MCLDYVATCFAQSNFCKLFGYYQRTNRSNYSDNKENEGHNFIVIFLLAQIDCFAFADKSFAFATIYYLDAVLSQNFCLPNSILAQQTI